jgi:uncharacterized protein YjbI with pentapeptide repeats
MSIQFFNGVDLRGADLSGRLLRGLPLRGANFSGANLSRANLSGSDLSRANLRGADLRGANLTRAHLNDAHLNDAHLEGANLTNASLNDAHLEGAHLEGANLQGAELNSAILTGAHLEGAILIDAILNRANLQDSHLNRANLTRASLNDTFLNGAHLEDAILIDALGTPNYERVVRALSVREQQAAAFQQAVQQAIAFQEAEAARQPTPAAAVRQPTPAAAVRQPTPAAAAHQGRAYEIHNYFEMLPEEEITKFLQNFNRHTELNQKTIQSFATSSSEQSLFTPLLNFIDNSELFIEKEKNKQNLNRTLTIVTPYRGFNDKRDLLNSTIEFVSKQSDDFIEQYIQILIDDCLNAYGHGGQSCVKGMFERIVTTLGEVAKTLTKDKNQENETYKTLKYLFPQINFVELVQEWAATYLEGGEKEEELRSLTEERKKAHFINFMETKYGGLLNETIRRKILEEAKKYQDIGVFERMAFGRRKGNKKTRRRINKNTRRKGNKKTMKKRKKQSKKDKYNYFINIEI